MSALFHSYLCGRIAAEWLIKMKKHTKVAFSLLLVVCMLISGMPIATPAIAVGTDNQASELITETLPGEAVAADTAVLNEDAVIVEEDTALRGEYEKHFFMSDGSYQVALYNEPVHKMEGGEWVEIDNTLTLKTATDGTARYATTDGLTDVSFSQSFDDQLITMQQDDYFVSWGVQAFSSSLSTNTSAELVKPIQAELVTSEQSTFSVEEQKTLATKSSSTIQYRNALRQNVDLEYVVLPSRVKENIILQSAQDISYYVVTVYTENLSARLLENREIEFYNDSDEVIFTMTSPYMYDNAGELSEDITVEMVSKGNGCYFIKMTPNAQWLSSESRVYPVVIDPQVSVDTTRSNIIDNYVLKDAGVQNRNLDRLYIGNRSEGLTRAFIQYATMPTLPEGSTITAATMSLTLTNGTDTAEAVAAYMVTSGEWASGTIEWANMPEANVELESNISHNNLTGYTFSCLTAVRAWYNGDTTGQNANYGIMIRYQNETAADYNAVYSADYTDESKRPLLTIAYAGYGGGSNLGEATTIRSGDTVELCTISANELRYFKFEPTVTANYIIQSGESSGDPKVWIYDSNCEQVGTDDDTGEGLDFRLSIALTAGQEYYIVAGHALTATGTYNITLLQSAEIDNGFYRVKNRASNLYMDIHGPDEQKYVHQWTYHDDSQEIWLVQKWPNGSYTIRSQFGDNLYLGIASTSIGETNVQLFSEISDSTRWYIYVTHSGQYIFEPVTAFGKTMYVPNSTAGTEFQLAWVGSGGSNAKWHVTEHNYSGFTFSAFDIGDSKQDEVSIVKNYLETYEGYTDIGSCRNTDGPVSGEIIRDISRYSDIVYINGHGLKKANLQIQDSSETRVGWLCAESSVDFGDDCPKTEIGAEMKPGSTTSTESVWNKRTKWVILAQCDQFDMYDDGGGEFWNGANAALVWACTMKGDGERLHGFLGYYNRAPEGTAHTSRLESFLYHTQEMSIIDAWKEAHPSGPLVVDTNWATLYYLSNVSDRIDSFTESNTPETTDTFVLERRETPSAKNLVSALSNVDSTYYPVLVDNASTASLNTLCETLSGTLCIDKYSTINIDENNRIVFNNYNNHTGEANLGMTLSDEQVIDIAERKLAELNLSPNGEYRTVLSYVRRYELNESGDEFINPETIEYTVCFYRTFNGVDLLSDKEEGIVVSFNKYGLTELQYKWSNLEVVNSTQLLNSETISQNQAKAVYQSTIVEASNDVTGNSLSTGITEPVIQSAYLQVGDEMKPVWVCSPNGAYGNHVFIDMNTGEQIVLP